MRSSAKLSTSRLGPRRSSSPSLVSACGSSSDDDTGSTVASASDCTPGKLDTHTKGELTVATDKPAYPPYFDDDDPTNGKGFESAVAYAIGKQLGFAKADVKWTVEPFNSSYAPGPEGLRLRRQRDLDHAGARKGGRLLGAVLHGQPGDRRAEGLRRGQGDHRSPNSRTPRSASRSAPPASKRSKTRSTPERNRRSSTAPTTSSRRSRTARSTRSSSTCRRRST